MQVDLKRIEGVIQVDEMKQGNPGRDNSLFRT